MSDESRIINRASSWFAQIPKWVFDAAETSIDLAVFAVLCLHASQARRCFPPISLIAEEAKCSERSVQDSIRRWCEKGYLRVLEQGNGRGKANLYEIVDKLVLKGAERVQQVPRKGAAIATQHIQEHINSKVATIAPFSTFSDPPPLSDEEYARNREAIEKLRKQLKRV